MSYNFEICGQKWTVDTSLKSPDNFLYGNIKDIELEAFLGSLKDSRNYLISYHKMTIVPVSLRLAVYILVLKKNQKNEKSFKQD